MPEMTAEESAQFARDLEDAESMSRASLSFRCARALAVLRTVWKSRRELQERVAEREEWCGKLHFMYSGAEHYIGELEDELRPLRVQRGDAFTILANTATELGAAEGTRWEVLPEVARELRARVAEVESERDEARAELQKLHDDTQQAFAAIAEKQRRDAARIAELEAQLDGGAR